MKTLQLRLPDSVHERLKELARQEGVSLNQILVTAASNEVVRQETREFFQRTAAAFDETAFKSALAVIPAGPVTPGDEIDEEL